MAFLCSSAFVSCDSDEVYFKSKCTAVLDGQTYYDQLPLKAALNPSTTVTPSIKQLENYTVFRGYAKKKEVHRYIISIFIYSQTHWRVYMRKNTTLKKLISTIRTASPHTGNM